MHRALNQTTRGGTAPARVDSTGVDSLAAWAGPAFSVAFFVFLVVAGPLVAVGADTAQSLRQKLVDHASEARLVVVVATWLLVFLLLPFASAVASYLETGGRATRTWARLSFAGAVLAVVFMTLNNIATAGVPSFGLAATLSGPALDAVRTADLMLAALGFNLSLGLWVGAASIGILRGGLPSPWIAGLGLVILAAAVVVGTWVVVGDVTAIHNIAGGVTLVGSLLVWPAVMGLTILRRQDVS